MYWKVTRDNTVYKSNDKSVYYVKGDYRMEAEINFQTTYHKLPFYYKFEEVKEMNNWLFVKTHIDNSPDINRIRQFLELKKEIDNGILSMDDYLQEYNYLLRLIYLEYFNNFITIERFAEYYEISKYHANFIITKGRELM